MAAKNAPRSALTIMVVLTAVLAVYFSAEAIYLFTLGGWPLLENGRWSHGLFNRMITFPLLAHPVIIYGIAMRSRQPRWSTVLLYPLSLASTLFLFWVGLQGIWKDGGGVSYLVGAIVVPVLVPYVTSKKGPELVEVRAG